MNFSKKNKNNLKISNPKLWGNRKFKLLAIVIGVLFFTSCATSVNFPVSDLVPAAEIKVSKAQDNNNNYTIKVTAENLASATRLDPPKNNYVVWIVTEDNGVKNVGQLVNKNAKKVELKTTTPFNVEEIFITAEDEGSITYPSGIEITRTTIK